MSLEFTSLPPTPRGMNLAGPSLFIDDAYCRWMQDVLVDRPGQIRMRGPLTRWNTNQFDTGEQVLGSCETVTPSGVWRTAVFTTGTSDTNPSGGYGYPGVSGKVKVFNADATTATGSYITLPFELRTRWDSDAKHWTNNTIIDAKPALGGGVWIGVTDGYGVLTEGTQALMFWRGAGKTTHTESSRSYTTNSSTMTVATPGNIESGMFAFDTTDDSTGQGRYLGTVANISGTTVTFEKEILSINATTTTYATRSISFTSFRGFIHEHGRGLAATDDGVYITSGRLGSDAEGFFQAARVTIGSSDANHRVYAYRNSDHQFIGQIKYEGIVSNTQVEMTANRASLPGDLLKDEAYFIIRNDVDSHLSGVTGDTTKYSMLASHRSHDSRPGAHPGYTPFPGVFNSTYANRQWFASVGNTGALSTDKFVNRVVFSTPDNPENINLSPDNSDSIIIPGREAIRGIAGSTSGLLVFVENKTYIIKGTNRSNFSLEELYPDGTLCTTSIVQVGGGVIWAGKAGIYYYDGVTVRNFTNETLGIYYTDGVRAFDSNTDRIYAFVFNNYLVINFSSWSSAYTLSRWQATSQEPNTTQDPPILITLDDAGNYTRLTPTSLTLSIFLPTGSIGTLSNFVPRGFVTTSSYASTKGLMLSNSATNTSSWTIPTGNAAEMLDLSTVFTEEIDTVTLDACISNDTNRSTGGICKAGPDFYLESKQYNFDESTLRKWWRKMMFSLRINAGYMMVEFIDINDTSLVGTVNGESFVRNDDETGFFLIPTTTIPWAEWEEEHTTFTWTDVTTAGVAGWAAYFGNKIIRYSRWLGIRKNSLGFKFYGLHGYTEMLGDPPVATEVRPELVGVNDWVFGLKPLRKGRN